MCPSIVESYILERWMHNIANKSSGLFRFLVESHSQEKHMPSI